MTTLYSMGFAVSPDGQSVLLLRKEKPAFLVGQWIGVGGHVEPGETFHQAMVREAKEEADLNAEKWTYLRTVPRPGAQIAMFAARLDLAQAKTMTEERVETFTWAQAERLPLAESTRQIFEEVKAFALGALSAQPSVAPERRGARP